MDKKRLERLRTNAGKPEFREAMAFLRQEADEASLITYAIKSDEQGQWTHYYHCHEDGTRLTFNWDTPLIHHCPTCSKERTGEPFDSAWTSIAHSKIGRAVYHIALLYAIEPDKHRLDVVKSYLMAYASHYGTYRIHGDIPYNGPGKLFAQTLDEAHWITDLALGFDVIKEHLTPQEEAHICSGLLEPCARFLIEYKEKQIHNHSVLITSAIAAIGLLLHDNEIRHLGLEGEYGLLDQISRGIFEDGLWYEGNVQYHFYAFKSMLHYAVIAEGTEWELWHHKALKSMFDFPLYLLLPRGAMPTLNDAGPGDHMGTYAPYYEIALDIYGDDMYRSLLHTAYGTEWADRQFTGVNHVRRDSVYALMFGQELSTSNDVEGVSLWDTAHHTRSLTSSGLTKLVNAKGWQVILKHSRFGGEHDHMDRLGISAVRGTVPLLIDPGTTAYGIPAHYGWFKHTYSHNTVSLNGADQPPRDGRIVQLVEENWGVWAETAVDWLSEDYQMKERIILPRELSPWDDKAYKGTIIRRINVLMGDQLLDIVSVTVPDAREVHLTNHFSGKMRQDSLVWWESTEEQLSRLDQKWLKDKRKLVSDKRSFYYEMQAGMLEQQIWCSKTSDIYTALTPDNPLTMDRTSLIQRATVEDKVLFVQVLSYDPDHGERLKAANSADPVVVELQDDTYRIELRTLEEHLIFSLDLSGEKAKLSKLG